MPYIQFSDLKWASVVSWHPERSTRDSLIKEKIHKCKNCQNLNDAKTDSNLPVLSLCIKKNVAKYFKPEISSFNAEICAEAYRNVWAVEEGKQSAMAAFSDLETQFSWLALFNSPEKKASYLLTTTTIYHSKSQYSLFRSENKHNYNALWLPAEASKQPVVH